jgi:O-antigen ligase
MTGAGSFAPGRYKKGPALRARPSWLNSCSELAILIGLATLIRFLGRTIWILLLLAGLLASALLLAGLLTRVLVLLARVLVLVAHSGISVGLNASRG